PNAPLPGVSRADVLVAMLIVLVAGGLLLAAISRVREEAASASCQNKLKMLGLAAHNYHDTMDRLPPLVDQGAGALTGRGLPSVSPTLMPYTEATPVLSRGERPPAYYHPPSSVEFTYGGKEDEPITEAGGMANQVNPWFLDPADDTASKLRDVPMALPD